ncbi:NAD-dependent malic enzyme [Candidatus Micrarchaeota archaeon]|nr:NAD-dependent malic enzyme [Candidatus Micrarchaeota archaeon]
MDSISFHKKLRGKLTIKGKVPIRDMQDLSTLYTPGVAEPCRKIAEDRKLAYEYTMKGNSVAIVSDGSRVLGLGNIGPEAALPVMEGKALIMQQFAGIDAFPVCLDTQDEDMVVETVKNISPVFGAINLEDISTPKVFDIEKRLTDELDIPVFHDDQHGTAVVVLAGLFNALKVVEKTDDSKIAVVGAGSAGYAIAKLLRAAGFKDITVFDSKGAIHDSRNLSNYKKELAGLNSSGYQGSLSGFAGADVIISAASPGAVPEDAIKSMEKPGVVFALSNPDPEISLQQAERLEVSVFGTGRSDCPNQINNALCFPGFLRALLDFRVKRITDEMKIAAARGVADTVPEPTRNMVVPDVFDRNVVSNIKSKVKEAL